MFEPGVYRFQFRGLTLRECWRFGGGMPGFLIALVFKMIGKSGDTMFLPACDSEGPCDPETLSAECREHLAPHIGQLSDLGFRRGTYIAPKTAPPSSMKDPGAYRALHDDGVRIMFLAHIHNVVGEGEERPIVTHKVTATGEFMLQDGGILAVCDHDAFFDAPQLRRIVISQTDVRSVACRLEEELSRATDPKRFAELRDYDHANRESELEVWDARIRRGLYRKDAEQKVSSGPD